jgi:ribonuclease BN (tRNA processing enzyme)
MIEKRGSLTERDKQLRKIGFHYTIPERSRLCLYYRHRTSCNNAASSMPKAARSDRTRSSPYLVDFGTGIVRQAAAARKEGVRGLEPVNLRIGFLTHLHSDHTLGFPDLILTPWVVGRKEPLEVYGPPGTADMAEHILKAYGEDINISGRLRARLGT